jgi:hypothetical protein
VGQLQNTQRFDRIDNTTDQVLLAVTVFAGT